MESPVRLQDKATRGVSAVGDRVEWNCEGAQVDLTTSRWKTVFTEFVACPQGDSTHNEQSREKTSRRRGCEDMNNSLLWAGMEGDEKKLGVWRDPKAHTLHAMALFSSSRVAMR
eukprot:scaffold143160_cov34-Tisochrysis_lutea.AAC.1